MVGAALERCSAGPDVGSRIATQILHHLKGGHLLLRIGVDVGGTNTDAVVLKDKELLAAVKRSTTGDIESGVIAAIAEAMRQAEIGADDLDSVMIGTTQFTNAFVERRNLTPVGVIRLAFPTSTAVPPFCDWPESLNAMVHGQSVILGGGYEFDGREISPLDEFGIREAVRSFAAAGLKSVAISCAFAPLNVAMERRAGEIVREEMPEASITLSSAFNRIGLIERENATAMNASLVDLSRHVVASFASALRDLDISVPFFISQNDGTLMRAADVAALPVLTFASGPTNSIRGAAFLTGIDEAIVVDIGGTTTDIGVLAGGFPRESAVAVEIGGVRTNFRMPDILSIGLGGGSIVKREEGDIKVGPQSVGYRIREEALIFGGRTLTATDIAVAGRNCSVGDRSRVSALDRPLVEAAMKRIDALLVESVDRMKTASANVPVILVGGGAIIVSSDMEGVSEIQVPRHSEVANAVGAAIAQISGEIDTIFDYGAMTREEALREAEAQATAQAVAAGAAARGISVVEREELPLNYLPGNYVRVRTKVVGNLNAVTCR